MTGWRVLVTYENADGTRVVSEKHVEEGADLGGMLGMHDGRSKSLRGVRYLLVLALLSAIDTVEKARHTWKP